MSRVRSEWFTATSILSMIGLLISLAGNIYQGIQNHIINSKADAETTRAERAEERAERLQKLQYDWVEGIKKNIREIDVTIGFIRDEINLTSMAASLSDRHDNEMARERRNLKTVELENLLNKKLELEEQLRDYMMSAK